MTVRQALILAVITLTIGPACLVVFGDGHAAARRSTPPVTPADPGAANTKVSVDAGCVDRPLSYGLTNDQARGEAYDRSLLDPFAFHPPLPKVGYYPPGRAPDQAALIHALYHGYVVVRYRPALAGVVKRKLRDAVERAAQPVVVAAGRGMPFAVGALVYGRESVCGRVSRTSVAQLTEWIATARPRPARR